MERLIGRQGLYIERGLAMYAQVLAVTRPYEGKAEDNGLIELTLCELPHPIFNKLEGEMTEVRFLPVSSVHWAYQKESVSAVGYISFTFIYGADLLASIVNEVREKDVTRERDIYRIAREKMGWLPSFESLQE